MNILYVLRYYPTLTETFVYTEIEALRRQYNANITIVALGTREDGKQQERLPKVTVWHLPKSRWRRYFPSSTPAAQWLSQFQRPKDVARLPWLLARSQQFDVIHAHFAGEAAEFAAAVSLHHQIPLVLTIHAVDLFKPRPSLPTLLSMAAKVITISRYNQQRLRLFQVQAEVIRCGIDLEFWHPAPLPDGPIQALFIGRDVAKKGLDFLLQCWQDIPLPHHLTVISDRKSPPSYPNVQFVELQPPSQVRQAMIQSNLVVLPCMPANDGDMDGIPVVLMEAMAMGRPVITTALSGIPELITPDVGWLLPPRDQEVFLQAIEQAKLTNERHKRGLLSRPMLIEKQYTQQHHAQSVWNILQMI